MARSDVDQIARLTSDAWKTIMKVFFDVKSITLIDILSEKAKLSSEYFRENIIKEFDLILYPTGQKLHATRMCLRFDNTLSTTRERSHKQWQNMISADLTIQSTHRILHSVTFSLLVTCMRK
jgi:hypothetical protein